jgi:hypothetical protein
VEWGIAMAGIWDEGTMIYDFLYIVMIEDFDVFVQAT